MTMFRPRNRARHAVSLAAIGVLVLATTGGCPDFRNSVVDAVEGATRTIVLDSGDVEQAADNAANGVISAALTLLFDQLRQDQSRR